MTDEEFKAEKRRREVEERKRDLQNFHTLEQFVEHYRRYYSGHFFDANTMRYFATRLCGSFGIKKTPNGLYFVHTDKKCYEDYRREFKLRYWSAETANFYTVLKTMSRSEVATAFKNLATDVDFDPKNEFSNTEAGKIYDNEYNNGL